MASCNAKRSISTILQKNRGLWTVYNRWLIANKLMLHMTKTEFKLKSSRQKLNNLTSLPSLNINNVLIKHSHSSKPLSMLIDENLTCKNHVDTIILYIKENCVWLPINHCLPLLPCMLSITAANHILTTAASYGVARTPIGYWAQPPPIGHYREYPPCPKGKLPKIIIWFRDISYLHQNTLTAEITENVNLLSGG